MVSKRSVTLPGRSCLSQLRKLVLVVSLILAVFGATFVTDASTPWTGQPASIERPRLQIPEDRYAMAGGCYGIRAEGGGWIVRSGSGFSTAGEQLSDAEPFHFQATDLGSYLLFGSAQDFVAASEGLLGEAAHAATGSLPGQIAGGLVLEKTDDASDEAARTSANEAAGRGAKVTSAKAPSELADWTINQTAGGFSIELAATGQALRQDSGNLTLTEAGSGSSFGFQLKDGCARFPEVEVNVDGPVIGGEHPWQETRGFLDAHAHLMAFEFIGGRVRCGRPWHPYGVAYALVDCPDHQPGGQGAALEQVLSGVGAHSTDGWPTFAGWPRANSLTHEQVYYKWLERSWRGGLRMMVNLLVDNRQLCEAYPFKNHTCNEMDGVRRQAASIRQLERYIDAQSGGPGRGWFRIVTDPFQARSVMNDGKLAIVLGVEVSVPLDCGVILDIPQCDRAKIEAGLNEVYGLGVRQMELVNKFDNALSGVTGDGGTTGIVVNQGNKGETGHYWRMQNCDDHAPGSEDKRQLNFHDETGAPNQFSGRDSIFGAVLSLFGKSGAAPVYGGGPHCNIVGLSGLGQDMIKGLISRGMIFDPDHMSAKARTQAMDLIEQEGYSGVVSSHGWADNTIYPRIFRAGGVVTPHPGNSSSFVGKYRQHKAWADPRFYFGIGYGADTNGFSAQGSARGAGAQAPVTYPFTGFGGTTISRQVSGSRTYNINTDGVAHYGLYPDWMQDVRNLLDLQGPGSGDVFFDDMLRGPEAYLQMWERAIGIRPNSCRQDVADITDAELGALATGMSSDDVLRLLGQPDSRLGSKFDYCATGGRRSTLTFEANGSLSGWVTN